MININDIATHFSKNDALSYRMYAEDDINHLIKDYFIEDISSKRVLDVGMGRGCHFEYLKSLGADVYGFSLDNYLQVPFEKDKMFITDIRNMKEDLFGTFDIALQYRFRVLPEEDIPSIFQTIAKSLKPEGMYVATFIDGQTTDNKIFDALRELFNEVQFKLIDEARVLHCAALGPKEIKITTPDIIMP